MCRSIASAWCTGSWAARRKPCGSTSWAAPPGWRSDAGFPCEARKLAEEPAAALRPAPGAARPRFPAPDVIFREFEETFPFEETADQDKAIAAVLADMQDEAPMDRLVCGDVGYGKTEVALRASLLAALGGRQVAVLAPTTVLVEQHCRDLRRAAARLPGAGGVALALSQQA